MDFYLENARALQNIPRYCKGIRKKQYCEFEQLNKFWKCRFILLSFCQDKNLSEMSVIKLQIAV